MGSLEKWVDELQATVDKLSLKVNSAPKSSGTKITAGPAIGVFPEEPAEGDLHYLVDADGRENAAYRYDGEAWDQISGFDYALSDSAKIDIINGYGLFQKLGSSALADFYYYISELGYKLETGGGTFKKFFYCTEPVVIDPAVISGFTITGKFRNAALDVTVDWTEEFSQPYTGILMIGYGTDNEGNWLFWQVCRPYLLEANNNALHQGIIVAKQSGGSGDFIITGLKLNKVQPTAKRRKNK